MSDSEGTSQIPSRDHKEADENPAEAVQLLNNHINIALEKQRASIIAELQNKFKTNTDFKGEGNKIQFAFNEERLRNLDNIQNNLLFGELKEALATIESEKKALNYRNKLLRIAEKHGWDTVKEYTDNDLADGSEDAAKLRSAISRAAAKKRTTPYARPIPQNANQRRPGVFDGMSNRQLFLGSQSFNQRQGQVYAPRASFPGFRPNFSVGANVICHYCGLPQHFAKYCPYSAEVQRRQPPSATAPNPDRSNQQ